MFDNACKVVWAAVAVADDMCEIAIGSDADLVFFDPNEKWTIRAAEGHGRIDYSMFEGREVMGRIRKVFLRGQLIVDGAEWLGKEGMGQFVYRKESGRV